MPVFLLQRDTRFSLHVYSFAFDRAYFFIVPHARVILEEIVRSAESVENLRSVGLNGYEWEYELLNAIKAESPTTNALFSAFRPAIARGL